MVEKDNGDKTLHLVPYKVLRIPEGQGIPPRTVSYRVTVGFTMDRDSNEP
jgi:hypothetical protein